MHGRNFWHNRASTKYQLGQNGKDDSCGEACRSCQPNMTTTDVQTTMCQIIRTLTEDLITLVTP